MCVSVCVALLLVARVRRNLGRGKGARVEKEELDARNAEK
jgi:hypothetical protein